MDQHERNSMPANARNLQQRDTPRRAWYRDSREGKQVMDLLIGWLGATPTFPVFSPHSSYARSINNLSHGVLWAMLGILLLVVGLVSYATRRFRARPGEGTPFPTYGNVKLEVSYTVAFITILGVILFFSLRVMRHQTHPPIRPTTSSSSHISSGGRSTIPTLESLQRMRSIFQSINRSAWASNPQM